VQIICLATAHARGGPSQAASLPRDWQDWGGTGSAGGHGVSEQGGNSGNGRRPASTRASRWGPIGIDDRTKRSGNRL